MSYCNVCYVQQGEPLIDEHKRVEEIERTTRTYRRKDGGSSHHRGDRSANRYRLTMTSLHYHIIQLPYSFRSKSASGRQFSLTEGGDRDREGIKEVYWLTGVLYRLTGVLYWLTGVLYWLTGVLYWLTGVLYWLTGVLYVMHYR